MDEYLKAMILLMSGDIFKRNSNQTVSMLGEGIYLVPFEEKMKYGHLYKDNQKLSDDVFRVGGLGGKFNDGYCSLLYYPEYDKNSKENSICRHQCIINTNGDIIVQVEQFDHLYHLGGVLATSKKLGLINLLTGEKILPDYGDSVKSKEFLFVEHRWSCTEDKEKYPLGVYKISYKTGEYEIFS